MIQLRHTGLYVKDLERMEEFYRVVFKMHTICKNVEQSDDLIHDLLRCHGTVRLSKLITEQGKQSGFDDMLELLQLSEPLKTEPQRKICDNGVMHLGFGVPDIEETVAAILAYGGQKFTEIHDMSNGRKCCFCRDPEGNWLEIIQ
ncbi:VOC family protein [uncultured Selenomonas sp.]|uniref:VOC family protein n=1 Tax=uncultured Selenomonas sp. TaxID=159275 RepID=UPI0025878745|nr:VOC family protein [uncultured Selenomonas sp.]